MKIIRDHKYEVDPPTVSDLFVLVIISLLKQERQLKKQCPRVLGLDELLVKIGFKDSRVQGFQ